MKFFRKEIQKLLNLLKSGNNFSFSKYADGEWAAMTGRRVSNKEWETSEVSKHSASLLNESFRYKHPDYHVGISCPCCRGEDHYSMKSESGQSLDNLTFANVFVNGNYDFFAEKFIEEFKKREIHLIANEESEILNLPFEVQEFYPVGYNAWVENLDLLEDPRLSKSEKKLVLMCCGPLGNIIAHKVWEKNTSNTYLDIGSTLSPWLNSCGFERGYFKGKNRSRECIWGEPK